MVLKLSPSRHESLDCSSDFLFDQYDADGDGFVNQFDFSLFLWDLKSTSQRPLSKEQALRCWAAVAAQNGGRVTREDFRRGIVLLWEHDFFVNTLPDLSGVEEDTASTTSSPSDRTADMSSESGDLSRQPSISKSEPALSPSPSDQVLPSKNDRPTRHRSDGGSNASIRSSRSQKFNSKIHHLSRGTAANISTSVEDLINRLHQAELQLKLEEDELSLSATTMEDSDDEDILVPRTRQDIDFRQESVTVKRIPPNTQRLVRVYMEGDSYKTMAILMSSTAGELLKIIYEKMEVPSWEEGRYALYESEASLSPPILRPLKSKEVISDVESKGKRIYFREVATIESPTTPQAVSHLKPSGTKTRKLFGFLNK